MSMYQPSYSQQNKREEHVELKTPEFRAIYTVNPIIDLFVVPALKGLLVALIVGGFTGIGSTAAGAPYSALAAFGMVGLLAWGVSFWRFEKGAYAMVERMTRIDLNGNGKIDGAGNMPTMDQVKLTVRSEYKNSQGETSGMDIDHQYPGTAEQLHTLMAGILEGRGFEVETWAGPGMVYATPGDYKRVRAELLAHSLIQHKNGSTNQAYELTDYGARIFESYTGMKKNGVAKVHEVGQ